MDGGGGGGACSFLYPPFLDVTEWRTDFACYNEIKNFFYVRGCACVCVGVYICVCACVYVRKRGTNWPMFTCIYKSIYRTSFLALVL